MTDLFFSVTERKILEEAKAKLVALKNLAVNKHEILEEEKNTCFKGGLIYVFALAEKEALEAQNNVQAMELEILKIEAIAVKGRLEETFSRFPHIAEHMFENLDVQSFSKCQEVSRGWKQFISESKPLSKPYFQQLEIFTGISKAIIKKSLENYEFQTIQKMTNCASMSYKKAINEIQRFGVPKDSYLALGLSDPFLQPKRLLTLYSILSEKNLDHTQFLLARLMILKNMDISTLISTLDYPKHRIFWDARHELFEKAFTTWNRTILTKERMCGTIWSSIPILCIAVTQNHLSICKLIFEKNIQLILVNWKLLLRVAILFSRRPMCHFFIDKIQDILPDQNWRQYLNEIAETSNGHKETCSFIESLIQKYK